MSLEITKESTTRSERAFDTEEILLRANGLFRPEQSKDLRGVIAEKIEDLRHYDLQAMERIVAIVSWGRSGSLLLSSLFDGHEDVMMLPELCGWRLYEFFERYQSFPLRDKLIAYAAADPEYVRFFDGNFPISPAQYYAAVQAIVEFYNNWPPEFLASRRTFFLFVHIAYNLALGRRPSSHPLIVHAFHERNTVMARHLIEDFPQAKFVHTIRDPVSSCNGMFHYLFGRLGESLPRTYIRAPYSALECLINKDRPHLGMESRTRTLRFEDLHSDTAETMRDVSEWLSLPYQPALLNSTFNGIPYRVKRDGISWSGARMEQIRRQSPHLSAKDRALLFVLFCENFVEWGYACPKIYRYRVVRCIVAVSLSVLPTKMEITAAQAIFKRRILPALRNGNILVVIKSLLGIGYCRLKIIRLLALVVFRRCARRPVLLQVNHKGQLLEQCAVLKDSSPCPS